MLYLLIGRHQLSIESHFLYNQPIRKAIFCPTITNFNIRDVANTTVHLRGFVLFSQERHSFNFLNKQWTSGKADYSYT